MNTPSLSPEARAYVRGLAARLSIYELACDDERPAVPGMDITTHDLAGHRLDQLPTLDAARVSRALDVAGVSL